MLGGMRQGLVAVVAISVTLAATAVGCGGDDDSNAQEEPKIAAASEPANVFIERLTKLLATSTTDKDCQEIPAINGRSKVRFPCPAAKSLRKSLSRFEIVGVEEYGTGAVVDYKSGQIKDGAAIMLIVAPDRNWGVAQFGIITKPSTKTSDARTRAGYRDTVDQYLAAVRERDCAAYAAITFNGDAKPAEVCKDTFPRTKPLAKRLRLNPGARPRYEGGNGTYGFYTLETQKPTPENITFGLIKVSSKAKGGPSSLVMNADPSPTAAQQKQARKTFDEATKSGGGEMKPSDVKPSEPAVPGQ